MRLSLDSITYVEKEGHDLVIHARGERYRSRMNIKDIEGTLLSHDFAKCNRGCIVNLCAVDKVSKNSLNIGGSVKAMGVMSSFNRIGTRWAGGDYRLLTTILRDEWGFEGVVICDFNTCTHMIVKDMVYAGGDLNLEMAGFRVWKDIDADSAADVSVIRQASKNILYPIVNSNAYRGDFIMHMPVWQVVMIVIDCVLLAGLAVWGFFAVKNALKKQNNA